MSPVADKPPSGEGVDNPVYASAVESAVNSSEQSTAVPEGPQRPTYDDFGGLTNEDSIA